MIEMGTVFDPTEQRGRNMSIMEPRQPLVAGKSAILSFAMLLLVGVTAVQATTIDDIRIEGWYGTGVNRAVMVIDFGPGNGDADSFAFGVKFGTQPNDTINGYQMLQMARDGTPLENGGPTHILDFDSTYYQGLGYMVSEIWYTDPRTSQLHDVLADYPTRWWSYFTSGDSGVSWSDSWYGAEGETVSNGSVHGWMAEAGDAYPNPNPQPVTPFIETPEPSTLMLAVAGGLALLVWRGRRAK
jgi:hypothetical protein